MLESKKFRHVARAAGLTVPVLALLTLSCSRAELAPDCFQIDPATGVCLIPYPGASDVTVACEDPFIFPDGAIDAEYSFNLNDITTGGTGVYGNWVVTGLPPGLSVDADSGEIIGIPEGTPDIAFQDIQITVTDIVGGETYDFDGCGEMVVNRRLNVDQVRLSNNHCVPYDISKEELLVFLNNGDFSDNGVNPMGGDGTEITCTGYSDTGPPCPLGDGNGRPPPGISFDDESCTHSGSLSSSMRGTWVWMVEIEQSGVTTTVPFCASNDIDTYHNIGVALGGQSQSDLVPGVYEYNPGSSLVFGQGDYEWDIVDDNCVMDPTQCSSYGFRYDVTCSPFDPPFQLGASSSATGLTHTLTAMGPTPADKFRTRPFVASFEMRYCTANNSNDCDVDSGAFDQNAQTEYHFDVVGYPVVP